MAGAAAIVTPRGSNCTVIHGVAAAVKPPRMGLLRTYWEVFVSLSALLPVGDDISPHEEGQDPADRAMHQ